MFQRIYFKQDAHIVIDSNALTSWQCMDLGVVKESVHVLYPLRIDISIEDDPLLSELSKV